MVSSVGKKIIKSGDWMNDQLYIEVPVNYIYDQLLNEEVAP